MDVNRISTETPCASPPDILNLTSEEDLTTVQEIIKDAIRKTARLHPYNNVDTFVGFHKAYRDQKELSLEQFMMFNPVRHEDSLSCVGLSYKVMKYVSEAEPILGRYLFLAICGQFDLDTPDPTEPPSTQFASLFTHVLVALEFSFKGRKGYIFADNAFLVDFPFVIMADHRWPHTGHFHTLCRDGHRENDVQMINDAYAVWNQTDYKPNGETIVRRRLVYIGRPVLQPDIVERRAQVIPFHGYILMGPGGFKAGLFVLLGKDNQRFTLSVPNESGELIRVQFPYEFFCSDNSCGDDTETRGALEKFSNMCGFEGKEALMKKFRALSETCKDSDFIEETVVLNKQYYARLNQAFKASLQ